MRTKLAALLLRFYPRIWRDRYGTEFKVMLESSPSGPRTIVDILFNALSERIFPVFGGIMEQQTYPFSTLVRKPTAFLPIVMSLIALSVVVVMLSVFGVANQPKDEGTAAHIWQLLMAGQLPLLAFFAIKWLRRARRQALYILALQAGAIVASLTPVFFFHL